MNTAQIIANHITNRQLKISVKNFVARLEAALKQPKTSIIRSGDVLFVLSVEGDAGLVSIINGSGPVGYLKAVKQVIAMVKKLQLKYIKMRVTDKTSAEKIATTAGLKNVTFETVKDGATDPYMMTAEL